MKKILTGILLSFALMMVMLPALGVSQAAYAESEKLYVGTQEVDLSKDGSGTGWSYIASSSTLTLTDATITEGYTGDVYGIYYNGSKALNIVLTGDNNIKAPQGSDGLMYGIYSDADITISGDGSLSAEAIYYGIWAKNVTIVGGTVNATGTTAGLKTSGKDIKISGGTVKAIATGSNGNAIHSLRHVDIEGGTVEATGGDVAVLASGEVKITGGSVTASGTTKGIDNGTGYEMIIGSSVRVWAGDDKDKATDVTQTFATNHNYKWVQTETATLWVGGIPVTSRNADDILGAHDSGVSASYDYDTETLTLDNYSYESDGYNFDPANGFYAAIYANQDLEIQFKGISTVKCAEQDSSVGFGIYSNRNALSISGSGTLDATGYGDSGAGIYTASANITINDGTVNASGHNGLSVNGGRLIISDGIFTAIGNGDKGVSADDILVADKMGINAGDSKKTATGVDKEAFRSMHVQHWVQISEAYPLWVRGIWVMVTNKDDVLGDGKVSFDPKTNTLKLDGADIKADPVYQHDYAAIYYEDKENELNIDAAKDGSVEGPDYDDPHGKSSYGIFSKGPLTVKGRLTSTGGKAEDIYGIYAPALVVEDNAELTAGGDTGISINEGKVDVKGKLKAAGDTIGLFIDNGSDGVITVSSGAELTATGDGTAGIAFASDKESGINIREGAKVSAVGGSKGAVDGIVKNDVSGLGWTNTKGTEGKTEFRVNKQGQVLGDKIKKAVFPAPEASVTKAPAGRSLTYTGQAQKLVTAGTAKDGGMQYALGTDGKTPPATGWSASIPEGTDAGDYYVWYKAAGDDTHSDSEPACVKVTIAGKTDPAPPKAKPVAAVKGIARGKTSLKFTWNKVKGAAKYEIWMSKCNTAKKKYSVKKIKTLGAGRTTFTKKKLKKNTAYKFRVVAKDASGKVISKSRICHAYTGNVKGSRTNVKKLKLSTKSFTLNKGDTAKIKATQTKVRPDKKLCFHAKKLRYTSTNTSVAKVDSSGKITAAGTGTCKIYVQTVNGIWKTVRVNVN